MTLQQLYDLIDERILSRGRRTTARNTRYVLKAMVSNSQDNLDWVDVPLTYYEGNAKVVGDLTTGDKAFIVLPTCIGGESSTTISITEDVSAIFPNGYRYKYINNNTMVVSFSINIEAVNADISNAGTLILLLKIPDSRQPNLSTHVQFNRTMVLVNGYYEDNTEPTAVNTFVSTYPNNFLILSAVTIDINTTNILTYTGQITLELEPSA